MAGVIRVDPSTKYKKYKFWFSYDFSWFRSSACRLRSRSEIWARRKKNEIIFDKFSNWFKFELVPNHRFSRQHRKVNQGSIRTENVFYHFCIVLGAFLNGKRNPKMIKMLILQGRFSVIFADHPPSASGLKLRSGGFKNMFFRKKNILLSSY